MFTVTLIAATPIVNSLGLLSGVNLYATLRRLYKQRWHTTLTRCALLFVFMLFVELLLIHRRCRRNFRDCLIFIVQHHLFQFFGNVGHCFNQLSLDDEQGEVERRRQHLRRQRLANSGFFALHGDLWFVE